MAQEKPGRQGGKEETPGRMGFGVKSSLALILGGSGP